MVTSRSGSLPVQVVSPGHYICDKNCLQWTSSQICSHTLAAAEINGDLQLFLQWYTSNDVQPNITQLATANLPKGRGQKGGIPKRKRLRTPAASPAVIVSRPATQHTLNSSLDGNHPLSTSCSIAGLVSPRTSYPPNSTQLNELSSISVSNFSPHLQSTQVGNSTANLSISQSLVITTSPSSFTHSQLPVNLQVPVHIGGANVSPSVNMSIVVPNTNPFMLRPLKVTFVCVRDAEDP